MKDFDNIRLHELFLKLSDSSISADELAELDSLVSSSPVVARRYNEFIAAFLELEKKKHLFDSTGAALESIYKQILWKPLLEDKAVEDVEIAKEAEEGRGFRKPFERKVPGGKKYVSRRSLYVAVLSAAALICLLVLAHFLVTTKPLVATVVKSWQLRWAGKTPRVFRGELLRAGSYVMEEGTLDMQLLQGAKVSITAPAAFELVSEKEVFLDRGKLIAHVPEQAMGFTVNTPTGKVIDIGTRFGVYVDDALSKTEITVIEGLANVNKVNSETFGKMLKTGNACLIRKENGGIENVPVWSTEFAIEILKVYESVIRETNPSAYWNFSKIENGSVTNVFGRGNYKGRFEGDVDVYNLDHKGVSETEQFRALSFGGQEGSTLSFGDENVFNPGKGSFTMSLWFKPGLQGKSGFQNIASKIDLLSSRNKTGWQIQIGNNLIFIRTNTDSGYGVWIYKSVDLTEEWHHIVMVIDRQKQKLFAWFDGSSDGWETVRVDAERLKIGENTLEAAFYEHCREGYDKSGRIDNTKPFRISGLSNTTDMLQDVPFEGLVYDVAVWKYALSENEIEKIYQYGVKCFE